MIKKFFITGTDTNVGKTVVSSILLQKASIFGYKAIGYKPVSSSYQENICNCVNNDAILLKKSSSVKLSYQEINPITFYGDAPPHILSQIQNKHIKKRDLSIGLKNVVKKSNWIIVEGAGGWYSPLSYQDTFADWVKEEKLTVVIIVRIRLGCINHAILTEKAIISEKIKCGGWIANNVDPYIEYNSYYIQTLSSYIKSPLLGIVPYFQDTNKINFEEIDVKLPE